MPSDCPTPVQLDLFIEETHAYTEALDRYALIQPLLTKQRTLRELSFTPRALSLSQRLTQAIGPEHLLLRFRTW